LLSQSLDRVLRDVDQSVIAIELIKSEKDLAKKSATDAPLLRGGAINDATLKGRARVIPSTDIFAR
jgi:hypothetical protein